MSYPMTWRRLMSRNGLTAYPEWDHWAPNCNLAVVVDQRAAPAILDVRRECIERYADMGKRLISDVNRLEVNALDEHGLTPHIAERTGISRDDVAAVLQAFLNL